MLAGGSDPRFQCVISSPTPSMVDTGVVQYEGWTGSSEIINHFSAGLTLNLVKSQRNIPDDKPTKSRLDTTDTAGFIRFIGLAGDNHDKKLGDTTGLG